MNWRALLTNRWALAGIGVAGAAGLYVWWRRRGSATAADTSTGAQSSPAYAPGGVGTFDSTGTDVAAWLGNYSANLQNQLDAYQQSLTDAITALQALPTNGAPPAGPSNHDAHVAHERHLAHLRHVAAVQRRRPSVAHPPTRQTVGVLRWPARTT